jgi:excisionase family DNA binding protein
MSALSEDYVTVDEAARLLKVAPSTIRRWIREGDLPAYRIGRRRVALRQSDLATLIKPARAAGSYQGDPEGDERIDIPPLTSEEKEQALAALERARERSRRILSERGETVFTPPSWVLLNESRDERTRQHS